MLPRIRVAHRCLAFPGVRAVLPALGLTPPGHRAMLPGAEAPVRALFLAALAVLVVPDASQAAERPPTFVGTVSRVVDGDTLHFRAQPGPGRRHARKVKVRLYGIDAPEARQPFGTASTRALERLVLGREVEVYPVTRDAHGRLVALVRVNGLDVSSTMVRGGYAWAFRLYLGRYRGDDAFCFLEYEARDAGAGLWALEPRKRSAPWVYRHRGRERRRIAAERSARDCVAAFEGR